MRELIDGVLLSISFFTQFPIFYKIKNITDKTYKYLALSIPLNGILLSIFTLFLFTIFSNFSNSLYGAFLASIIYLFMYGFLHIEAVSDIVDAYYARHSGKDSYEILKDSHIGSLGAIAGFCIVLLKVGSIIYILNEGNFIGFIAILFLSRAMATLSIYRFDFHSNSKFIYSMKNSLTQKDIIIFSILIASTFIYFNYLILFITAISITYLLKEWLLKNIGFINGDGLGFIIEINEIILLNILIFS